MKNETSQQVAPVQLTFRQIANLTPEEFAAYASKQSEDFVITNIRTAPDQAIGFIKQAAQKYWVAGVWLNCVREKKLYGKHGDWGTFCNSLDITTNTALKYREFAAKNTYEEIQAIDPETFNLERAIGWRQKNEEVPEEKKKPATTGKTHDKTTENEEEKTTIPFPEHKKPTAKTIPGVSTIPLDRDEEDEEDEETEQDEEEVTDEDKDTPESRLQSNATILEAIKQALHDAIYYKFDGVEMTTYKQQIDEIAALAIKLQEMTNEPIA